MSTRPKPVQTNSIEIFIDADGSVTFSDLPSELQAVLQSLSAEPAPSEVNWCSLLPLESQET